MSFEEFAALVGPPSEPPIPVDWDAVESWLGVKLPSDYKALASAYGPAFVGEWVWVHTPAIDGYNWAWDYTRWVPDTHRHARMVARAEVPEEPPPFCPERGGLLAWGEARSGAELFWDTSVSPDPDQWGTVLLCRRERPDSAGGPWHRYALSTTDLLVATIRTGVDPGTYWGLGPLPPLVSRPLGTSELLPWVAPIMPDPTVRAARQRALESGNDLETLAVLVPPPAEPVLGESTWDDVAERLGTLLPADYRVLMECYGEGVWRDSLAFFSRDRFVAFVQRVTGIYRDLRSEFPEFYPLAAWPEPCGFLPFADQDGDMLSWLTVGDPDDWPLVVVPHDDDETCYRIETGLVEALLAWCRGADVPGLYDSDPLDDFLELAIFRRWADYPSGASNG